MPCFRFTYIHNICIYVLAFLLYVRILNCVLHLKILHYIIEPTVKKMLIILAFCYREYHRVN